MAGVEQQCRSLVISFSFHRMRLWGLRILHAEKEHAMKTVTIPQKMSGTGTIHDLASQHFEREIKFREGQKFAIVLASYYGDGNMYWTTSTIERAIKLHEKKGEYSHAIMDDNGNIIPADRLYGLAERYA